MYLWLILAIYRIVKTSHKNKKGEKYEIRKLLLY